MRLFIVILLSLLIVGCNSTSQETDRYRFESLTNSHSISIKQRLVNPENQIRIQSWFDSKGDSCDAKIGDWEGEKIDTFSVNNIQIVSGDCVDGIVVGAAIITFDFIRVKTTQAPTYLRELKDSGKAVLKGKFKQGRVSGAVEIYTSESRVFYALTKEYETKVDTQVATFTSSLFNNAAPSGQTLSIIDKSGEEVYLHESEHYNNGLLTGTLTIHTNFSSPSNISYKNGLLHGYSMYAGVSGACYENGIKVMKLQDECAK